MPFVTVLIAARPGQAEVNAVLASRQLDYPKDKLEIIVARGRQPSVQRNTGIRAAKGELIYFLDDDSIPPSGNLRQAVGAFTDAKVQMIGGPNLCPPDAPMLEQVFALVHASLIAFGPSRARYASVGKLRETSEKELILCNLFARKSALVELHGFNEALYPNEENALMDKLQKRGGKLLYDPQLIIHRRPRHTLKGFARMLLSYGRGRAEQFRLHPTAGSTLNFVPPLFFLYLLAVPFLGWIGLASLAFYAAALVIEGAVLAFARRGGVIRSLCAIPLIAMTNILYGAGFWRGLFTRLNTGAGGTQRPKVEVVLETVPL